MLHLWRCRLLIFLLSSTAVSLTLAKHSFENSAIVRTVELGGASVHVTTTYAVRAQEDDSQKYTIALSEHDQEKTHFIEVKLKGQSAVLPLESSGYSAERGAFLYSVELPKALKSNATANIVVETVQTHASFPWPDQASQTDPQYLKYTTDLFVLSPYHTLVQRTKIRSPTPKILEFTEPDNLDEFTTEAPVTKSGATITYGPYHNIPPSDRSFVETKQKPIVVQYGYDNAVLEIVKLERAAEISHWGANLNIQDNIWLHNAGPTLKGHFSRFDYQSQAYYGRPSPQVLAGLTLHLPAGIHDVYYYDTIGNVSTSHFRAAPSARKGSLSNQPSIFEMRPRYPVLGGWNYSFTLGWDAPLADYAGFDAQSGKYIVGVPLLTVIPDTVVDEAEIKIILPEGATDVEYFPPFPAVESGISTHVTYLDTVGRPAILLKYVQLTDRHSGVIYVSYKVPLSAHLKKPRAVATAFLGLFALALAWRRYDTSIQKK